MAVQICDMAYRGKESHLRLPFMDSICDMRLQ